MGLMPFYLYRVQGDSMLPSVGPGDLLLVRNVAHTGAGLARDALVIVLDPRDGTSRYLKRVVGVPGEEVRLFEGLLFIDGAHFPEPYLGGLPAHLGLSDLSWRLGPSQYFVMGDNRAHSTDSRKFGPVDDELIIGKVWARLWPPSRLGTLRQWAHQ